MIPRWHIVLGGLFTGLIYLSAPQINSIYLALVFFSSFLIDIDHYIVSVIRTRKLRLKHSFKYHEEATKQEIRDIKRGIKKRGDFHLLHTIEFHILIGILSIFFTAFFYIFIGMVFHSLTDLFYLFYVKRFHRREFFFFNWLRKRF